ncbi:MAG: sigma-54 dependent transcriptional regulator [Planctomycetaceae bacterium]
MHILVVDDEPAIGWTFREGFQDEGFSVDTAGSAEQALQLKSNRRPDVILMDVRLPGMNGLDALATLKQSDADIPVIMMTAFGSLSTAVEAIDRGAFDYLTKPVDLDRAIATVKQALAVSKATTSSSIPVSSELIIGRSAGMQEVFRRIALVAELDLPVLITGESGTGKDLVARAIHRHSRRKGAFVPICIPALSESVVESELFGHVRGAFTGANEGRPGLLEVAENGTAFVDEIGDVSLNLQAKLLRTLETREILPVGSREFRQATFRLVAATNRPLESMVQQETFRGDLFYRLNVFRIELPPLRDRVEDIPELAAVFLSGVSAGRRQLVLADDTIDELMKRPWYGNVRELRNAVESASVVCRGEAVLPEHLPRPMSRGPADMANPTGVKSAASADDNLKLAVEQWVQEQLRSNPDGGSLYQRFLEAAESTLLPQILTSSDGNRVAAARILGMHRETLREKLRRISGDG